MWDGYLGRINIAEHRIVLSSTAASPIHSASYRTGSKQWKLEREEIGKMREAGVADPPVTERSSPVASELFDVNNC